MSAPNWVRSVLALLPLLLVWGAVSAGAGRAPGRPTTGGPMSSLLSPEADLSAANHTRHRTPVFGRFGFNNPNGIAVSNGHVWVANSDSLTEVDANTGKPFRLVSGPKYDFENIVGVGVAGGHVWVASNAESGS